MLNQDFITTIMKFSPYIQKVTEKHYPSPESLDSPRWHSWIIPHHTNIVELHESIFALFGEYRFKGAYREELSTYAFDEDPRVPQIMLHIQSKTGVHIFLLGILSSHDQYSLFTEVVRNQSLQINQVTEYFIAMLDDEIPKQSQKTLTVNQIESTLAKHSHPYRDSVEQAQVTLHSIYERLLMNNLGHALQEISVFYTTEPKLKGIVGAILFRGGRNRDCHVFLPFFEKKNSEPCTIQCNCLSTILTGITTSDFGTPILPNYSCWVLSGATGTINDLQKIVRLISKSKKHQSSISINSIYLGDTGQISITDVESALSFFNFAVPNVKHQIFLPVTAASVNARLSEVPLEEFFNAELDTSK